MRRSRCSWRGTKLLRARFPGRGGCWRGIPRLVVEDHEIAGYPVTKGMGVAMAQWVVHRDPRWYDSPEEFRPERWEDDLLKRLPRFAYFPFGGGPRQCIGNAFAVMEATLILAT